MPIHISFNNASCDRVSDAVSVRRGVCQFLVARDAVGVSLHVHLSREERVQG